MEYQSSASFAKSRYEQASPVQGRILMRTHSHRSIGADFSLVTLSGVSLFHDFCSGMTRRVTSAAIPVLSAGWHWSP
ncbi:MAG: hypothetical protein CBE43_09415 [Rhodopirellula sp. TMED283]|nr:MAG: hypothetical protein CBE43_09415 [Rhodopirellula sp. TMED283]